MKKRVALIAAAMMMTLNITACSKQETQEPEIGTESEAADSTVEIASALELMETIWASYGEEEKPIVFGGDLEHVVDGAPGAYDIADTEGISAQLHLTEDAVAMADEAASAIHAMNANTFTSAAFHVTDAANTEAFAASAKESILSTQWMCGFPEKLVILSVSEDYVLLAFGNGDMIEALQTKAQEAYGEAAVVLVDEVIE